MQMVRIAFILPHLRTGGIEHVVARLLAGLDRRRFTPLLYLRNPDGELLALVPDDVERADAGGARALVVAPRLARWLRHERVDLVYSGTNAMNLVALAAVRLIALAARPQVIVSEHTSTTAYLAGAKMPRLRRALIRRLYPKADLLMAPTDFLCHDWAALIGRKVPPVAVAHNPVFDPAVLATLRAAPPRRIPGRVICAGRLIADKGHDIVLRAVAALASEIPDLHLWIFGEGPERENLAALIAQLGLEGRAVLKGTTPQLMQEMAAAQVLAVGSRREGFGNVVVEGLAAGTQVVATTCPGPRAILADGQLGRLVPPDDVAAMTDALRAALTTPVDPTLSNRVGAAIAAYSVPGAVSDFEMQCLDLLARTANRGTVPA